MRKIKSAFFTVLASLLLANPVAAAASTLALSPATATFNSGCSFSLAINLDTGTTQTDGTDVILIFDPSRFTGTSITKGTLYSDYPVSSIDNQAGKVTMSGLASVDKPFTGAGTFATINFTVAQSAPQGASTINFDFDPNNPSKTTDSNVVERGTVKDTLSSVTNGNYTIGTGKCSTASPSPGIGGPVSTASASISATPTPQLPVAGEGEKTMIIAGLGTLLVILGVAGLALL